ncbi:hypothetical protein [Candidatus Methanocrinis natronophilus]|uniref:Uncharacterized protein n=1 Tax=Candidatus Methanocrinis natronophilus TaxID=3033396 RepID=A0ABT5X503_9EURY|nr:hypothetical protein [Candidatus Methanocrinis natronophilus]MDF0589774.1 hypothetical protein [Candidatus Methanocrinis natronophilus]
MAAAKKFILAELEAERVSAAAWLDSIHRLQDRIAKARPGDYFESEVWQRLDREAQKICRAAGW